MVALNVMNPNTTLTSSASTNHLRHALQALPYSPDEEVRQLDRLFWRPEELRDPNQEPFVHMACAVTDSAEGGDDQLLRSELVSALRVMRDHMSRWVNHEHYIFPVSVNMLPVHVLL